MKAPELLVDGERIGVLLPAGYTAVKIVHQRVGSHGTADPLDLRDRVIITLKAIGDE